MLDQIVLFSGDYSFIIRLIWGLNSIPSSSIYNRECAREHWGCVFNIAGTAPWPLFLPQEDIFSIKPQPGNQLFLPKRLNKLTMVQRRQRSHGDRSSSTRTSGCGEDCLGQRAGLGAKQHRSPAHSGHLAL